jgi:dienelactone hydrolase
VLLVTGVHPDGIDEARLLALATDLAGTGINVVTPEIPDLRQFRLTARVTDTIEHAAEWLADQPALSGGGRIGMIGVSFSGGLSIVAAGRPALRDRVAYVLSFGGHGNLPRVLRFFCTGIEPPAPGGDATRRQPHDYALAVLLHQAADLAVPPDQAATLRRGIETFLHASALARIDLHGAQQELEWSRAFQRELPEPSATLLRLVNEREVAPLGARLLPYLDRLGQDPALSPDRSPAPAAPVYLLHGIDDNVIPAVESQLLAAHLDGATRVHVLLSSFLRHVDVSARPTLTDTWRMIAFWKAALGER